MQYFPKALTNADGERIVVHTPAEEAEQNELGYFFGGPPQTPSEPEPAPE